MYKNYLKMVVSQSCLTAPKSLFIEMLLNLTNVPFKLLIFCSLAEIISRVKERADDIPFRPHLGSLETSSKTVIDVIRDCWDEEPSRRPDFKIIRNRLKPMQKGMYVVEIL